MALSLNPIDVLKLFSDRRYRDKEQIASWLELTAADARITAYIWAHNRDAIRQAKADAEKTLGPSGAEAIERQIFAVTNVASFTRLEASFESLSSTMNGRIDSEFQEEFTNQTAEVMVRRNHVKQLYDNLFGRRGPITFFDTASKEQQLDNLDDAIDLLMREAAALEVMARNFRASR